jgi:hypothetical protein
MARLRAGALDALVDLIVDDLLARPAATFVDPDLLATELSSAFVAATSDPTTETWLSAQLRAGQEATSAYLRKDGRTLGQRLPEGATASVARLLAEPWVPDRRLVDRLVDHEAMVTLVREVLQGTLVGFGHRLRNLAPEGGRFSGLGAGLHAGLKSAPGMGHLRAFGSSVAAVGSGLGAVVSAEIEHQIEERARDFVAGALRSVLADVAGHLTDPKRAGAMSGWRKHAFDAVLDADPEIWASEVEKMDPARLAHTVIGAVRAFARRPELSREIAAASKAAVEHLGDRTLCEMLRAAGLEESWKRATTAILRKRGAELIENPAFEEWIGSLVED